MNDRLGELLLGHELPVALYTYRREGAHSRGTWTPFCDHSPEWVALARAHAVGATALFVDLPAWDEAFEDRTNRYSDLHLRASDQLPRIAHDLGFDTIDALWDHLFEVPQPLETLATRLSGYFEALRAEEPASGRDDRREAWMARWIGWALAQDRGPIVVVCGGFHEPALRRMAVDAPTDLPVLDLPAEEVGSYLVPFSDHRLDRFSGYASGMPSPAYQRALYERPDDAWETMLFAAARRLRERALSASTADVAAAHQLCSGLAQLRGHPVPTRVDVLDGLAGALVKHDLTRPLPWTVPGALTPGTDALLVELVSVFSGDRRGRLHPSTPQPPIVADVRAELARVGIPWTGATRTIDVDAFDEADRERRQVLHRLRLLEVPEVVLLTAASLRRGGTTRDRWTVREVLETEPVLIERAVYGGSLAEAARQRLLEAVDGADTLLGVARGVQDAVRAGYPDLVRELGDRAQTAIEREPLLASTGEALEMLLPVFRADPTAAELVRAVVARAVWLLEGLVGPRSAVSMPDVRAVAAIRRVIAEPGLLPPELCTAALAVFSRRAGHPDAPPAIRGASLGALWGLDPAVTTLAPAAARAIPAERLGDWLAGLFALAREPVRETELLGVVDERIRDLAEPEFLAALPALRRAFAFFPPRERIALATELLRRAGASAAPETLLRPPVSADVELAARAFDDALALRLERYGLG